MHVLELLQSDAGPEGPQLNLGSLSGQHSLARAAMQHEQVTVLFRWAPWPAPSKL